MPRDTGWSKGSPNKLRKSPAVTVVTPLWLIHSRTFRKLRERLGSASVLNGSSGVMIESLAVQHEPRGSQFNPRVAPNLIYGSQFYPDDATIVIYGSQFNPRVAANLIYGSQFNPSIAAT